MKWANLGVSFAEQDHATVDERKEIVIRGIFGCRGTGTRSLRTHVRLCYRGEPNSNIQPFKALGTTDVESEILRQLFEPQFWA